MFVSIRQRILIRQFLSVRHAPVFLKLYNLYATNIFRLAMQLTGGDQPLAEGLTVNAWTATAEKLFSYPLPSTLWNELVAALIACSKESYRQREIYLLISDDIAEQPGLTQVVMKGLGADASPEWLLGWLPVGYRHVFVLHDLHRYSQKEISGHLGISECACRSQLFRARTTIRQAGSKTCLPSDRWFLGWTDRELKGFRSAFRHIDLPQELGVCVINQLYAQGLLQKADPVFSFLRATASFLS